MGLFTGIEDAQVGQGGVYFLEGKYLVEIVKVMTLNSRKKEDLFIVEAKILKSSNPERKVGITASWIVNLKHDAALGNIKGFVAAANGISPSDKEEVDRNVDEEAVEYACSEDNPLAGVQLDLECVQIKTREKRDFTLHKWNPA